MKEDELFPAEPPLVLEAVGRCLRRNASGGFDLDPKDLEGVWEHINARLDGPATLTLTVQLLELAAFLDKNPGSAGSHLRQELVAPTLERLRFLADSDVETAQRARSAQRELERQHKAAQGKAPTLDALGTPRSGGVRMRKTKR